MTLSQSLARAMCCPSGCATPDACRAEQTQMITIRQAVEIAVREMPVLLCAKWRAVKADSFNVDRGREW